MTDEQKKFFESILDGTYESDNYFVEPDHVSDNPVIQKFYEKWLYEDLTDDEWLNFRDEILEYMDKYGNEQDSIDLQEFMESVIMMCDGIEEERKEYGKR